MRRCILPFLLLSSSFLNGCSNVVIPAPPPAAPTHSYPDLTGNWDFTPNLPIASLVSYRGPLLDLRGALQSSGPAVTGTLHAITAGLPTQCILITQNLTASGTVDQSGNLTLTVALPGGAATLHAALNQDLHTYSLGSWQVDTGPCATPVTPARAAQYASTTGTYQGVLSLHDPQSGSPIAGSDSPVTITLAQSATPNPEGAFPLTGTIIASGPTCTGSFSFTSGVVFGNGVFNRLLPGNPAPSPGGLFDGAIDPTATTLAANIYLIPGCQTGLGSQGTLTRQ